MGPLIPLGDAAAHACEGDACLIPATTQISETQISETQTSEAK